MIRQTNRPLTAALGPIFVPEDILENPQPHREKTVTAKAKWMPQEYGPDTPGWPWDL